SNSLKHSNNEEYSCEVAGCFQRSLSRRFVNMLIIFITRFVKPEGDHVVKPDEHGVKKPDGQAKDDRSSDRLEYSLGGQPRQYHQMHIELRIPRPCKDIHSRSHSASRSLIQEEARTKRMIVLVSAVLALGRRNNSDLRA